MKVDPKLIQLIESAVLRAGKGIIRGIASKDELTVEVKSDSTLVTNLDLEAQVSILETLGDILPIAAEETESSHQIALDEDSYFLVDPLDGTTSCKRFLNILGGQVGFGPLIGLVQDRRLTACCFLNIPARLLFTAVRDVGSYMTPIPPYDELPMPLSSRQKLNGGEQCARLIDAAALFFVGNSGETRIVEYLRHNNLIENVYRFGGFANDCSRLARGTEQLQVQFSVKPWDLSAVLLSYCAGYEVLFDPLKRAIPLTEWNVEMNNPVLVAPRHLMAEVRRHLEKL